MKQILRGKKLFTEDVRAKLAVARGCPVNRRIPTKMSKESFEKMCLSHYRRNKGGSTTSMSETGFTSKQGGLCMTCPVGQAIEEGSPYILPVGLELIDLLKQIPIELANRKCPKRTPKKKAPKRTPKKSPTKAPKRTPRKKTPTRSPRRTIKTATVEPYRRTCGTNCIKMILTKKDVRRIRELKLDGHPVSAINVVYHEVSSSTLYDVVNNITWKDI